MLGSDRTEEKISVIWPSNPHDRNGAPDRKDGNRGVEPKLTGAPLRGAGYGNEGANFEPPLPSLAPRLVIPIRDECVAIVAQPPVQELPIPRLIDAPGIRGRGPMRDPSGADH